MPPRLDRGVSRPRPRTGCPPSSSVRQGDHDAGRIRHVVNPARGVENLRPLVNNDQFQGRVSLLDELEQNFHRLHGTGTSAAHRTTYQRAVTLMQDRGARAQSIDR